MRLDAMRAGVKGQQRATFRSRPGHEPIEERVTMSARPAVLVGHEIVHVENSPGTEPLHEAKAGDRADLTPGIFAKGELVTFGSRATDARDKFFRDQLRAELRHHREATGDVDVAFSETDVGHGHE